MNNQINPVGGVNGDGNENVPLGSGEPDVSAQESGLDRSLREAGSRAREGVSVPASSEIIVSSLHSQLHRLRVRMGLLSCVAAVAVVALLVGIVVNRDADGPSVPHRSVDGTTRGAVAFGAAEKLVQSLPPQPVDPHKVQLVASVSRFDTCDSLLADLRRVGAEHVGSRGFGGSNGLEQVRYAGFGLEDGSARAVAGSPESPHASDQALGQGGAGGGETLGTNVIVEGVDEPDTVKATGSLVFDLVGTSLRVTDTHTAAVAGTLDLRAVGVDANGANARDGSYSYPYSMLADGTSVVVFGSESVPAAPLPDDPSATRPSENYLTITFVDVSDPSHPSVTDRVRIEGSLVAARRVGGKVRIVTESSLSALPMVYPTTPNSVAPALRQNRLAVAGSSVDDWIPDWDRGRGTTAKPLVGCDGVVVPDTFAGVEMTSLVQFGLDERFDPRAISILAPSENLTATAADVVVASHVWVDPAKQTGNFRDWSTALHRFTFSNDRPSYVGSGAVPGSIRDDFSLSVLDDSSIAAVTADVTPWADRDKAEITVRTLSTRKGSPAVGAGGATPATTLDEAGTLVLGRGSGVVGGVRFMGDRLLVTSGLLDTSIAVVDLTNRSTPVLVGKVALGGIGEYIHPVAADRVLVLGSKVVKVGDALRSDLQVVLVDLAGDPSVVDRWVVERAGASAVYDHHAFTWWASRSLAGFGIWHNPVGFESPAPPQAAFLTVDGNGIIGRTVTPRDAELGPKCPPVDPDLDVCDFTDRPSVERVLVVDSQLWLYTSESLEHLDADSLASRAVVALRPAH